MDQIWGYPIFRQSHKTFPPNGDSCRLFAKFRLHAIHIQTLEVPNGVALEPMDPIKESNGVPKMKRSKTKETKPEASRVVWIIFRLKITAWNKGTIHKCWDLLWQHDCFQEATVDFVQSDQHQQNFRLMIHRLPPVGLPAIPHRGCWQQMLRCSPSGRFWEMFKW